MTAIGFVIQPGESIPEEVISVTDRVNDDWRRTARDHWHCGEDGVKYCDANDDCAQHGNPYEWAPLTVTAVREQPAEPEPPTLRDLVSGWVHLDGTACPEYLAPADDRQWWCTTHEMHVRRLSRAGKSVSGLCEVGADKVTCIVMDADHRRIYHNGRPVPPYAFTEALLSGAEPDDPVHYYFTELRTGLTSCGINALDEDEDVSTTDEAGKATCEACRVAVDEEPAEYPRCDACGSEDPPDGCHIGCPKLLAAGAESVPVDVLDLVRQHAIMHTACVDLTNAGAEEPAKQHHKQELALFARIEAEVRRLRAEVDAGNEGTVRLAACVDELAKQRDAMAAHADHWEAEAVALREKLAESQATATGMRDTLNLLREALRAETITDALAAIERLRAERDEARAALAEMAPAEPLTDRLITESERLRRERNDALAEVERLREVVRKKHAEIESQATGFLEATNKLIAEREWAKGERDEVLAEVERLKANVRAEGEISDSYAAWADRLAHAAIERLNVPLTDEGQDEVWEVALTALQAPTPAAAHDRTEQARDNHGDALWIHGCGHVTAITAPHVGLLGDLIDHRDCTTGVNGPWRPLFVGEESATTQPTGPLVLTLPEVPEGAVALIGEMSGHRWIPTEFGRWADEATGQVRGILPLLEREGSVTVEMAPPREPRTWPKLDDARVQIGTRVRGASGQIYVCTNGLIFEKPRAERLLPTATSLALPLAGLQQIDGPLTEVFDEDGADR